MRSVFYFVLCTALLSTAYSADPALDKDFIDFVELLPIEEFTRVVMKYIENPEFMAIIDFVLNSQDFKDIVVGLEQIPEYVELLKYLDESGLDVFAFLKALHDMLELPPPIIPEQVGKYKTNRSLMEDMITELSALLPKEEIRALHEEKMKEDGAFRYFVERIISPAMFIMIDRLIGNPDYNQYVNTLESHGIYTSLSHKFLFEIIGLN